jgi:hypothetical protein
MKRESETVFSSTRSATGEPYFQQHEVRRSHPMTFLDAMTLVIILIVVATTVAFMLWLASVPGKVARQRGHAQADAVSVAGWLSILTLFTTWPLALIWAYFRPVTVRVVSSDAKLVPATNEGGA